MSSLRELRKFRGVWCVRMMNAENIPIAMGAHTMIGGNMSLRRQKMIDRKNFDYKLGDKLSCKSWSELKRKAFQISSLGYGVEVIGFHDMSENILTITALPEKEN